MEAEILKRLEALEQRASVSPGYELAKKGMYLAFALVWCFGWALLPKMLH